MKYPKEKTVARDRFFRTEAGRWQTVLAGTLGALLVTSSAEGRSALVGERTSLFFGTFEIELGVERSICNDVKGALETLVRTDINFMKRDQTEPVLSRSLSGKGWVVYRGSKKYLESTIQTESRNEEYTYRFDIFNTNNAYDVMVIALYSYPKSLGFREVSEEYFVVYDSLKEIFNYPGNNLENEIKKDGHFLLTSFMSVFFAEKDGANFVIQWPYRTNSSLWGVSVFHYRGPDVLVDCLYKYAE